MKHPVTSELIRDKEDGTDLWRAIMPLVIWALHFIICYIGPAVYCAKWGREAPIDMVRGGVLVTTGLALAVVITLGLGLWRVHRRSMTENDFDFEHNKPEERHRFLSHVGLMLSVLSAVAIIFVAYPVLVLETCR
jgi:hypothetical protein